MKIFALLLFLCAGVVWAELNEPISLALLNGGSEFFDPVGEGWKDQCSQQDVKCLYDRSTSHQTTESCVEARRAQVEEWLEQGVQGIALKPCSDVDAMKKLFQEAKQQSNNNVKIVTFDSDILDDSVRDAHVGTDNFAMGQAMARLLQQLKPEGGTYVLIGWKSPRNEGFEHEMSLASNWRALEGPTEDYLYGYYQVPLTGVDGSKEEKVVSNPFKNPVDNDFLPLMERAAALRPTAMVFTKQTTMRHERYADFVDRHSGITFVGADAAEFQLQLLQSNHVHGLVAQNVYEIGQELVNTLVRLVTTQDKNDDDNKASQTLPELKEGTQLKTFQTFVSPAANGKVSE